MDVCARTHIGNIKSNNEDRFLLRKDKSVFAVADGVGSLMGGEIASKVTIEIISDYLDGNSIEKDDNLIESQFMSIIKKANRDIFCQYSGEDDKNKMATTLVLGYVSDSKAHIFNIGDSRCYHFSDDELKQVTVDHTYVNELILEGVLNKEEAKNHSEKHHITKAIGILPDITPDYFKVDLKAGDILIFCSDGLYDELEDYEIIQYIKECENMECLSDKLLDSVLLKIGMDNITAICLKI